MKDRERLDIRMVHQGLVSSRSQAQALIMAGKVEVNGRVQTKSGLSLRADDRIHVKESLPYVSRGGLKLQEAMTAFHIDPRGFEVLDIGASTGGFTDCWLQSGASSVYAVDVGYGQLHWSLRTDGRVHVVERTNARYLTAEQLQHPAPFDAASIDVSFIGLHLVLAPLRGLLSREGIVVALVKPQFEAGPHQVGRGGVVRDRTVHRAVLERVIAEAHQEGFSVWGLTPSPILGPQGNREFLLALAVDPDREMAVDIQKTVDDAWKLGEKDG